MAAGYGGDVTLAEDEDKPSVRQLLKLAAQDLNVVLAFGRRNDSRRLQFVVLSPSRPRRGRAGVAGAASSNARYRQGRPWEAARQAATVTRRTRAA